MASTATPDSDQNQQNTDNKSSKFQIGIPDSSLGNDDTFVRRLTDFINSIHMEWKAEFWKGGKIDRCQPPELRDLVASGQLGTRLATAT